MSNIMKGAIFAFLALLGVIIADVAKAAPVYTIQDDFGGVVQEYKDGILAMKQQGAKVIIDGRCASACTLVLDTTVALNTCITPKAAMGFHKPFGMTREGKIVRNIDVIRGTSILWEKEFYNKYPRWVKDILDVQGVPSVNEGDDPSKMTWIHFPTLKQHMKVCS